MRREDCRPTEEMVQSISKLSSIDPLECRNRTILFSRENMAKNYINLYKNILTGNEW